MIRKLIDKELLVLCSHLDTELCASELEDVLSAGIVITGASSILPGLKDTIERELQFPVRRAQFPEQAWLECIQEEYASSVGLVLRGANLLRNSAEKD